MKHTAPDKGHVSCVGSVSRDITTRDTKLKKKIPAFKNLMNTHVHTHNL